MKLKTEGYLYKKLQEEIDKCEIKCANCHKFKTAKDFLYFSYVQLYCKD